MGFLFYKKRCFILPMCIDDKFKKYKNSINKNKFLLFVGSNFFGNASGLKWYIDRVVNNIDLPVLDWELLDRNLNVSLDYKGEYSVSTWKAFNENGRDFRLWQEGELWKKSNMKKNENNKYNIQIENNNTGYQAIMVEFTLDPDSDFPLKISTGPFVFPNSYPYKKYEPIK